MEVLGSDGITQHCLNALVRLLSFGEKIRKALLISHINPSENCGSHAFMLIDCFDNRFFIRSGFSSGYSGEGPAGLSKALSLLLHHGVEVDEILVKKSVLAKLNAGGMDQATIEKILKVQPVRPTKFYDYIQDRHDREGQYLKHLYPVRIPLSLIDQRIMDLAINFLADPDIALLNGYRRLEDRIRKRTGLKEVSGSKLFAKAFNGNEPAMYWEEIDSGEATGRANLFTAIYMSYRNRRAHKESNTSLAEDVREFLMLNELYVLESTSIDREIFQIESPDNRRRSDAASPRT